MDRLASLPTVFHRIQAELDSPDASVTRLSHLIASDPALTAMLLKVANSALFGFSQRIDTISRAVTVLGLQQVRELSVAILVTRTFTSLESRHVDPVMFWRSSVLRAVACRAAFHVSSGQRQERGFVTGLLANLGHMVMFLTVPELAIVAANRAAEESADLALVRNSRPLQLVYIGRERFARSADQSRHAHAALYARLKPEPIIRDAAERLKKALR